jgi:putative phage-type endonuclease
MDRMTFTACEPVSRDPHGSPAWHAARRRGIGGSDAAALLGMSAYTTRRTLWEIKTGQREGDPGNAYTRCGQLLEAAILDRAYHGHAYPGDRYGSMRSLAHPFMLANIDGTHDGRLVEIKTTGKAWRGVPDHYVCQVRHYLYVCGLDAADLVECHVRVDRPTIVEVMERCGLSASRVVGELCDIRIHKVEQDAGWLAHYLEQAARFWRAVEANEYDEEDLGW